MAWGGPEELQRDREAGNTYAKDWHDEALKIVERMMQDYWDEEAPAIPPPPSPQSLPTPATNDSTLASEFDRLRRKLIEQNTQGDGSGWRSELRRYLSDIPEDVLKETDIVKWWANHAKMYPTLARIAKDICAIPATSVPCERLFSAGAEIATDRRSRLGAVKFKKIQMLKHAWRDHLQDQTRPSDTEEVSVTEFQEIFMRDSEMNEWNDFDETVLV